MADQYKKIEKQFKNLKRAGQLRVMRNAMNAALNIPLKQFRSAAPVGKVPHKTHKGRTVSPGFLKRSIKKSSKISKDRTRVLGSVFAAPEAYYGSFINKGWRPGRRSRRVKAASRVAGSLSDSALNRLGDTRKKIAGTLWWSKVADMQVTDLLPAYRDKIASGIQKELNRK